MVYHKMHVEEKIKAQFAAWINFHGSIKGYSFFFLLWYLLFGWKAHVLCIHIPYMFLIFSLFLFNIFFSFFLPFCLQCLKESFLLQSFIKCHMKWTGEREAAVGGGGGHAMVKRKQSNFLLWEKIHFFLPLDTCLFFRFYLEFVFLKFL